MILFFTPRQVENLLEQAAKNRAMTAILCNEISSTSHSVFMLKISGHNIMRRLGRTVKVLLYAK